MEEPPWRKQRPMRNARRWQSCSHGRQRRRRQEERPGSRAKPKAKPEAKARPKQTFNVNHFRAEDFRADGLRSYAQYRDLGMSKATNGLLQAHVIRMVPPCDPTVVSKRHYHDVDVQMIYVLKGWIKSEFDGQVSHHARRHRLAAAAEDQAHRASTIPTTASCWRSSCRRNSTPWSSNRPRRRQ